MLLAWGHHLRSMFQEAGIYISVLSKHSGDNDVAGLGARFWVALVFCLFISLLNYPPFCLYVLHEDNFLFFIFLPVFSSAIFRILPNITIKLSIWVILIFIWRNSVYFPNLLCHIYKILSAADLMSVPVSIGSFNCLKFTIHFIPCF